MDEIKKKRIIIGIVVAIVLVIILIICLETCDKTSDIKVDSVILSLSGNVVTVTATNTSSSKTLNVMLKVQIYNTDTNSPISESYTETLTLSPGQSAKFTSYHSGVNPNGLLSYRSKLDAKVIDIIVY